MKKPLGIYVHIPFCVKKCGYCDFCSVTDFSLIEKYVARMCEDIISAGKAHGERYFVDTVYFGGGTPTCVGEGLCKILSAIRSAFELNNNAEISFEANPATADTKLLRKLRESGFNRLSIGIQSANENELRRLGRIHTFEEAVRLTAQGRAAGFEDIGGDLMLGIPEQTRESMARSICALAALGMEHISAYMLKIEPNTPFGEYPPADIPDEDETAEIYLEAVRLMQELGYSRYEISNFAKPGFECRHNMKYWTLGDYLGFGPTAHSCFEGRRTSTEGSVKEYCDGKNVKKDRGECGDIEEYIMLSLRTRQGVSNSFIADRYSKSFRPSTVIRSLEKNGLITVGENITLTDNGILVSNGIITELIECYE